MSSNRLGDPTFNLFHRLWTKAVGTPEYDKKEWQQLEREYLAMRSDRMMTLAIDKPWPLPNVLEVLIGAADHLLLDHDCDRHSNERVAAARDAARAILANLKNSK